jgi:hypothetical protein
MAQYEVIRDVGLSLAQIMRGELSRQKSRAKVAVGAPTVDFIKKNSPGVVLYLYQVLPSYEGVETRDNVIEETQDAKGPLRIIKPPPLLVELHYMVIPVSDDPAEEHGLLSLSLKAFEEAPILGKKEKQGETFDADDIPILRDPEWTFERQLQLWQSFNAPFRPSVGYKVGARIYLERELSRVRRVEERELFVFDKLRPPPGRGEGADRTKLPAPVRKK